MKLITEMEIRAYTQKLLAGSVPDKEFKEGQGRGGGRLVLSLRKGSETVISEWYVHWHREGQRRSTKIGSYPALSIAAARKRFRMDLLPAILAGKNPQGDRAWTRQKGGTVKALFEAYIEDLRARGKTKESIRGATYALLGPDGAAKAIGEGRLASEFRADDLIPHLAAILERGSVFQANNVRVWVRTAFEFGIKSANSYTRAGALISWGLTHNFAADIPADEHAFKARDRFLSQEEFRAFWDWLTLKGNSVRYRFNPAIQICLATGQRPTEVLRLRKDDFDVESGTVFWSTTKNGRPHLIPLPPIAIAILKNTKPNEAGYFFPSVDRPDRPAENYTFAYVVNRYLKETGSEKFVARDIRRTWKTLAGAAGLPKEIRDRIQNHALGDVSSKHYDRYDYLAEKREAMALWSRALAEILTGDPNGEVAFAKPVRVSDPNRPRKDGLPVVAFPPPTKV